ncbi:hypothetical protein BS78_08G043900 [Paspalum vaginatum]|nr:hypothetical protein BS78_08G043900 [Paspalum vaginatum]
MEASNLEAKLCGNDHGHKRSDLDLVEEPVGGEFQGGDAKRPRECNYEDPSDDMEIDEEMAAKSSFEVYRNDWLRMYGNNGANSFEAETELPPMRYTDIPVLPIGAKPGDTMEVFFVKVAQITNGLSWPLDVYGIVAVRDSVDSKRNYLFRRGRDNCQTLCSPEDSLLELTGPSRAILLWDEPVFEIDLKVKNIGSSSSEDMVLCLDFFEYNNIAYRGDLSYTITKVVSSKRSTMEVRFAHLKRSVEATITAHIVRGSGNFRARLTACNTSIGEDAVLLDTRGQEVSVTKDGEVALQRHIVVVEDRTDLVICVKAVQPGDTAESCTKVDKERSILAKSALRNECFFNIGSSRLRVLVAWSLVR